MTEQSPTVLANRLALEGGTPVRTAPLPWELPGAHWIGKEERELVDRVIDAQSPFRFYGPDPQHMVDTLEQEWRAAYGHRHALGVSSGTAALSIAISALDIGPGDEVLIAGYMWVSCVSAIVRSGAIPRLVDIDETFCMDPADLRRKITPRARAILLVHMSGAPGHVAEIAGIAKENGLALIEDCAQAAGASSDGTPVGRFGDIATFSFQLNKNMTAGDGGMIVCQDDAIFRRITALHDLGFARNEEGRLDTSDETCQLWGFGARMSDLAGAMALAQSRKLDQITGAMRTAKWRIREALSDIPQIDFRTVPDPSGDSGPFLVTLYRDAETCQAFTKALRAEGIRGPAGSLSCITMREWGLHWYFNIPSLTEKRSNSRDGFPWTHPLNAFAAKIDYRRGALPNCDALSERGALLAIASKLTDDDVTDIITAFRKVANALFNR
ncbi:DegT/DnrJ/EryC1/StrS family aminotransferase [Nitratireductor aquimarinus]|uniref:DegT/DnrJ/EryC1/StrS family aminotransferase n=1 Tax=Nitratireductor aquimarinus TaxID=889300 RepID=UPI001CD2AA88|nr:DegT/DnrJ/EryC1/StrS family aminotransferase [Nitratireductor aquimarinus]MCA1303902.1 DegT/DnrJ/EryC1/StrS family aminotransferase [Nitratireductor aquimarinus]